MPKKTKKRGKISSEEFLKKASGVASFYGFEHILNTLEASKDIEKTIEEENPPKRKRGVKNKSHLYSDFEGCCANFAEIYYKNNFHYFSYPILTYYSNNDSKIASYARRDLGKKEVPCFTMQVIGVDKHIGEIILLKTALIILNEAGFDNSSIILNSIGDNNSANNFEEEFSNYIRSNLHNIFPTKCKQNSKKDAFETFECIKKHSPELLSSSPKPIQFISESSREHLRQIIEHFDMEDVIYELDDSLVGSKKFYSETVFEIRDKNKDDDENKVIASGGRYNNFLKNFLGIEVAAIGITIKIKPTKEIPKNAPTKSNGKERARIYLIQIGFDARIKSFVLLENLRNADMPITQSMIYEKIDLQIKEIEKLDFKYLIIIGQKEALENVAIIRKIETQAQDTVPINKVVKYLKAKKV